MYGREAAPLDRSPDRASALRMADKHGAFAEATPNTLRTTVRMMAEGDVRVVKSVGTLDDKSAR